MAEESDIRKVAAKWQNEWEKHDVFRVHSDKKKPKYYVLEMFPYPSAAGLHMGHALNYTIGDIYARFKRMKGFNVLYPMGYDAFGLPAENAAIKAGEHPGSYTMKSMANFELQQKALGLSYDWDRKVVTCSPEYYKWNQYFFVKLFEKGLVYRKRSAVNWCPKCHTVLANEQVHSGKCWRHEDTDVEMKQLEQWFIKTTAYTEELLDGIKKLDWPERIKIMQENWIGKSHGTEIEFEIPDRSDYVILHGYSGKPEGGFRPWLKNELEKRNCHVSIPALPNTNNPEVKEQTEFVLKNQKFDKDTVLVGHSLGCAVALKVVENLESPIKKLILAAGFLEPNFKDKKRDIRNEYDWKFDFEKMKKNVKEIIILRDSSDYAVPHEQADKIREKIGGIIVDFKAGEPHVTGEKEPVVLQRCINIWPIFTTRPDTIFGVTFMVVSAQHPKLFDLVTKEQKHAVDVFLKKLKSVSEKEQEEMEKEGVFTGSYAINPLTKEKVPVYAGNFVVADYGAGMVMAVPAHDQRDYEFAEKYKIPIKQVIAPMFITDEGADAIRLGQPFVERKVVFGIVKHWKEDKYFCLDWKKFNWRSFVIGGIEEGETPEEAVVREVKEETGYQDIKSVKRISYETFSKFFATHKGVNTIAYQKAFLVELGSEKYTVPEAKHVVNHSGLWVEKKDVADFLNLKTQSFIWNDHANGIRAFTDYGILINSDEFSGLTSEEAIEKITAKLDKKHIGKKTFNYKFRDWLVSRQRYWGTPIPMVYCDKCGVQPVDMKELPIILPSDVKFGEGNPLLSNKKFLDTKCPKCHGAAKRETDTMDTFFDSSWYYLRYCDNRNEKAAFDKLKADNWMPVDQYIGGAEHACMHLIYARFFTKALRDMGLVKADEPFPKLFNQGMLHGRDGNKMSKSLGNVVNPIETIEKYSADSLRFNLMSLSSPDSDSVWNDNGMDSSHRFVTRVFEWLITVRHYKGSNKRVKNKLNKTIKEVTALIEGFKYNLAIIKLREAFEYFEKEELSREDLETFAKLLHPFCPFMTEEAWHKFGNKDFISLSEWPKHDDSLIDGSVDALDQLIKGTMQDIRAVQKLANLAKIENIKIIVSAKWKYELYSMIKKELAKTRNHGEIIKALMASDLKKHGQEITKIAPSLFKDPSKLPDVIVDQGKETEALVEAKELIEETFDADVQILHAEDSSDAKAKNAAPGKPAIILS
ncbi:MAG: class I tRNA ligase family protein [archaeon]